MAPRKTDKAENEKAAGIEWIIAGIAALLVVAVFGFFVFEALTSIGGKPAIALKPAETREVGGAHYVEVEVENTGDEAAADVTIAGTAGEGPEAQTAEAMLDYAPAHSKEAVTLVFTRPVEPGSLQLQVLGFREP